jgi:hypothetical protein
MSAVMEAEIRRCTARRKSQWMLAIMQSRASVSEASRREASRRFDLPSSKIERWVDKGKRVLANAPRAKPENVRGQYERTRRELLVSCGEAMLV